MGNMSSKQRRSGEQIPKDEMILAEAIAAVSDLGLKHCRGVTFAKGADGPFTLPQTLQEEATHCCAIGALYVAGITLTSEDVYALGMIDAYIGNDAPVWAPWDDDLGESYGWAYRCAMEEPEREANRVRRDG